MKLCWRLKIVTMDMFWDDAFICVVVLSTNHAARFRWSFSFTNHNQTIKDRGVTLATIVRLLMVLYTCWMITNLN
jgi:hypothetical protein